MDIGEEASGVRKLVPAQSTIVEFLATVDLTAVLETENGILYEKVAPVTPLACTGVGAVGA